jgi:hypothetical protein
MVAFAERARLQRRGVLLEWFTVTWNVIDSDTSDPQVCSYGL